MYLYICQDTVVYTFVRIYIYMSLFTYFISYINICSAFKYDLLTYQYIDMWPSTWSSYWCCVVMPSTAPRTSKQSDRSRKSCAMLPAILRYIFVYKRIFIYLQNCLRTCTYKYGCSCIFIYMYAHIYAAFRYICCMYIDLFIHIFKYVNSLMQYRASELCPKRLPARWSPIPCQMGGLSN
jgi:hypothetical protein